MLQRGHAPYRRRAGHLAGVVAGAALGAWLGLSIGGRVEHPVGPVDTRTSAHLSWSGDTEVRVGPLALNTHDGPIGITVSVEALNAAAAQALVEDPEQLASLAAWVMHDLRGAIRALVIRSGAAAILGALALCLLVYRRALRRLALVGATAAGLVVGGYGVAAATWNPRAISEPRYTGLLVGAPALVGNAKDIVAGFSSYSTELAKLVGNVSKLYDVTSTLPSYAPDPSTIRVLQVSDIHLSPATWVVIASVSRQFAVQVVVDSGDLTDHGSKVESRFVRQIADLGLPYVWVRGNHDSGATQQAVGAIRNAVVLDRGAIREVAGLRFIGDGDPRFTPTRSVPVAGDAVLSETGRMQHRRSRVAGAGGGPTDPAGARGAQFRRQHQAPAGLGRHHPRRPGPELGPDHPHPGPGGPGATLTGPPGTHGVPTHLC